MKRKKIQWWWPYGIFQMDSNGFVTLGYISNGFQLSSFRHWEAGVHPVTPTLLWPGKLHLFFISNLANHHFYCLKTVDCLIFVVIIFKWWIFVWCIIFHAYMQKTSDAGDNITAIFLDFPPYFRPSLGNLGHFRPNFPPFFGQNSHHCHITRF